jgi:predicted dehydrogenase
MTKPKVNVALIGYRFMGRTHSNGFRQAKAFFDLPVEPVLKVLCGRDTEAAQPVADAYGWEEVVGDWREVVTRPDIDIVDIATPGYTHFDIAMAAAGAGKAIICEKPLANTLTQALEMADAVEEAGVTNLCNFNYRRVPAIGLAKQLIAEGVLGAINHWRGTYLQGWLVDSDFPLTWRLQKDLAGFGALGDIGSHSLDLARYLVGEITAVSGMMHTYTTERDIPIKDIGRGSLPSGKKGQVTVDDAAWALLRFDGGAFGTMESSRMATGRLNYNRFEINGTKGSLSFNLERLSELQYFNASDPNEVQGWRTVNASKPMHPYMKAWWPAGHAIGYEHTFTHAIVDFLEAYDRGESPLPTFRDAAQTQAVMEAIAASAGSQSWREVQQVRS